MRIYQLSQIGEFHTNHNEDALAIAEIGNDKILLAVMDGCSMGKESHFASTLIAKLLRKISKELSYQIFINKIIKLEDVLLKEVLENLFKELKELKSQLHLEIEEILSTLILGILDPAGKTVEVITVGDGLIVVDGSFYEYEQDDKPDYLGYHLAENFEDWFQSQNQKLSLKNISELTICTDGVFTFKNFDGAVYPKITEEEILDFLLINKKDQDGDRMLQKKILKIEKTYGLKPSDDLTMVRVVFN